MPLLGIFSKKSKAQRVADRNALATTSTHNSATSDIDSANSAIQSDQSRSERLKTRKWFARHRRLQARIRVFAWCSMMHTNGVEHISEWERLDVDAWVKATGYMEH